MLEQFGQRFLAPAFRCFLIWTNIIQIFILLSKLTLIRWTVYMYSGERGEDDYQTTKSPETQYNSVVVVTRTGNLTNGEVWTGYSNSSDFFGVDLESSPEPQLVQQIQFPILFMAAMMCIILYIIGLVGKNQIDII